MSREGKPRYPEVKAYSKRLLFVKGDALNPETFGNFVQNVDGVIHTVGTLIEGKEPHLTFKAINRDAAINVATELK